jgi:hypothetical protein
MADGLSIAASVAGLITLADLVVRKGYKYVKAVKDADKSLKALFDEVNKLSGILHSLKNVVDRLESDNIQLEPTTQIHYVEACYQALQKIHKHLGEADPAATTSSYDAKKTKAAMAHGQFMNKGPLDRGRKTYNRYDTCHECG